MTDYQAAYRRICAEIEIVSDIEFRHAGLGALKPTREIDPEPGLPVLPHLWRFLYLYYSAADVAAATVLINGSRTVIGIADREDSEFADRLSRANPGRGFADPGWLVVRTGARESLVRRDGLTLTVTSDEIEPPGGPLREGAEVAVRFPAERRYSNPGWYVAIGEAGLRRIGHPVVRLYYSLRAAGSAPELLRATAGLLNEQGVPFHIKVANDPAAFDRNDPVVLYLAAPDWAALRTRLEQLHVRFRPALRDRAPCFARRLGLGWSMAAEPAEASAKGLSFGQHRCILVAEGLMEAWTNGILSPEGRRSAVLDRLARAGVDPDRPYLDAQPAGVGAG